MNDVVFEINSIPLNGGSILGPWSFIHLEITTGKSQIAVSAAVS